MGRGREPAAGSGAGAARQPASVSRARAAPELRQGSAAPPEAEAHVIAEHALCAERRADRSERGHDPLEPAVRDAIVVSLVEQRDDIPGEQPHQLGCVACVLRLLVGARLTRKGPAVASVVGLRPPSVEHAEMQPAVDGGAFMPARPARLERRSRQVQPEVGALNEQRRRGEVVVLEVDHASRDLRERLELEELLKHVLAVLVGRVGLAGEHDLYAVRSAQQRARRVDVGDQQAEALIGRDAPREADGQRVRVEVLRRRARIVGAVASTEPLEHAAPGDRVDERRPLLATRGPQLVVGDAFDRRPGLRVGAPAEPAFAEVPIEERSHRVTEPGRFVYAVRNVADRHIALREIGPQRMPHRPRDLAVACADRVCARRGVQCELRQPERLGRPLRRRAAEPHESGHAHPDLVGERARDPRELSYGVGVVAGRNRCVRREGDPRADTLDRLGHRGACGNLPPRELQRGERRMPFVEMQVSRVDSHRLQRSHPSDAEQQVLREANVGVRDIQARGGPAAERGVLRAIGIQQVERNSADVDTPDLGMDAFVRNRHRYGQRLTAVACHERRWEALRVAVDPVLVLTPGDVDVLAEEALAVEQADGDERERVVRRLLEEIAGECTESAGIDRQRCVDAVLSAQEGGRPIGAIVPRCGRTRELGAERFDRPLDAIGKLSVAGGYLERRRRRLLNEAHRVAGHAAPAFGIEAPEQLSAAGLPRPVVVVGQAGETGERLGQPRGEALGGALQITISCGQGAHSIAGEPPAPGIRDRVRGAACGPR